MTKILIIGGTGYAGSFIAAEAKRRQHEVTVLSRSHAQEQIQGVHYVEGSAADSELRSRLIQDADIVIGAVSPRGEMAGKTKPLYMDIARDAATHHTRFISIGGFSSLRPASGQPRFFESGNVLPEYLAEAVEMAETFDSLKAEGPENLDWVFVSPAAVFGAYANVPDYHTYRSSNDIALFDENNESKISGADFALAVMDEAEQNKHNQENISFVH